MSHLLTLPPSLPHEVTNLSVDFMCTLGICKFKMLRMLNVSVCVWVCVWAAGGGGQGREGIWLQL